MKIKLAFLRNHLVFFSQILNVTFMYKEMKIHQHHAGHMTKMAAMSIYGKHTLNSSFHEPLD